MRIDYDKPRTDGYVGGSFNQPNENYNYDFSVKRLYNQDIDDNAAFNKRAQDFSDSFDKQHKPGTLNGEASRPLYFIAKWLICSLVALLLITMYSASYKTILLSATTGLIITVILKGIGYFIEKKVVNRL